VCVLGIVSEDSDARRLLVKQSYPLKTSGEQSCESTRKSAMEEVSRVITSDGTVIRTLLDGGTQVSFQCQAVFQRVHLAIHMWAAILGA